MTNSITFSSCFYIIKSKFEPDIYINWMNNFISIVNNFNYWIQNHEKNYLLKDRIEWHVNMLWSEKLWFVNDTIKNLYFDTEYYGWCDIGYFRNDWDDIHTSHLSNWANEEQIQKLDKNKIYYILCVN